MIPTAKLWKYPANKSVDKVKKRVKKIDSLTPRTINKYCLPRIKYMKEYVVYTFSRCNNVNVLHLLLHHEFQLI